MKIPISTTVSFLSAKCACQILDPVIDLLKLLWSHNKPISLSYGSEFLVRGNVTHRTLPKVTFVKWFIRQIYGFYSFTLPKVTFAGQKIKRCQSICFTVVQFYTAPKVTFAGQNNKKNVCVLQFYTAQSNVCKIIRQIYVFYSFTLP